ncbi:sigma factor-like helix-turn-helix DNA-binding protein [Planctomycetota bacterium]
MKKTYNKRQDLCEGRTKYNPAFWEVHVDQQTMNQFSSEQRLGYETAEGIQARIHRRKLANKLMPVIQNLMTEVLTDRQREIVRLYFLEQKTEYEISELLGITVATVSQHLFGKRRAGRLIGGAIPKLRKKLVSSLFENQNQEGQNHA